jgi:RND superfamily putative drug exporter
LLPAILGGIGPRIDWPRLRREDRASRVWSSWARLVVRRKWIAAGVGLGVLATLVVPVFGLTTGQTGVDALANKGPARAAYDRLLAGGVPSGVLTPLEVLTRSADAASTRAQLAAVTGIADAVVSNAPDSNRAGTTVVLGIPTEPTENSKTLAPVRAATAALDGQVAGEGAISVAYANAVFGNFPLMLGVIAVLTFVLLARAFRSIVLALKAIVLNLLSLAATFGVMTWFWQEGHGSNLVFGIPATGAITFWLPLMVFAFLFGLSMDYEVFILTRVREEYERTGSTTAAVIEGLGRTGRLVTSAALILFLTFASLASAPGTDIKVFATALGIGILIDATLVRALVLPALVALFGRWNWWLPSLPARLLRVEPSRVRT